MLTIDGFEQLSKQQMFDMAAKHILKTGKQSLKVIEYGSGCTYSGSGCAASVFIKPEYHAQADDCGPWRILVKNGNASTHEKDFIQELQYAHDRALPDIFMFDWRGRMRVLAHDYQLNDEVLNGE